MLASVAGEGGIHLSVISFRHRVGMAFTNLSAFARPRARRRCLRPISSRKSCTACSSSCFASPWVPLQRQFVRPTNLYSPFPRTSVRRAMHTHTCMNTEVRRQGRTTPTDLSRQIFRVQQCRSISHEVDRGKGNGCNRFSAARDPGRPCSAAPRHPCCLMKQTDCA